MLRPYRPVLAVPGSLRLFASALVARMPQGMSTLAILLVRDETHSYPAAGAAVGAFTWVTAALVGGIAAGSAAGGAVIGADGVGAPFVLACLAMALAAVLALAVREEEGSVPGADLRPLSLVRPLRSLVVRQRLR